MSRAGIRVRAVIRGRMEIRGRVGIRGSTGTGGRAGTRGTARIRNRASMYCIRNRVEERTKHQNQGRGRAAGKAVGWTG
jgi:hypothetical protein